jgi:hypothetical protein
MLEIQVTVDQLPDTRLFRIRWRSQNPGESNAPEFTLFKISAAATITPISAAIRKSCQPMAYCQPVVLIGSRIPSRQLSKIALQTQLMATGPTGSPNRLSAGVSTAQDAASPGTAPCARMRDEDHRRLHLQAAQEAGECLRRPQLHRNRMGPRLRAARAARGRSAHPRLIPFSKESLVKLSPPVGPAANGGVFVFGRGA